MKVFTRVAGLVLLGSLVIIGPVPAATPPTGTIGPTPGSSVSWAGGPYVVPTPLRISVRRPRTRRMSAATTSSSR